MEKNLQFERDTKASLEQEADPDAEAIGESEAKIAKLEEGLAAWATVLSYIDGVAAAAAAGNLSAVSGLMPDELTGNARNLNMERAPEAQAALEAYHAITFTGGGHGYQYETSREAEDLRTSGTKFENEIEAGAVVDSKLHVVTIGPWVMAGGGFKRHDAEAHTIEAGGQAQSVRGFKLADDDTGDRFTVQVFVDPLFQTYVFHTVAGRCGGSRAAARQALVAFGLTGVRGACVSDPARNARTKRTRLRESRFGASAGLCHPTTVGAVLA